MRLPDRLALRAFCADALAVVALGAITMSVYRFMFVSQSVFFEAFTVLGGTNAQTAGVFSVAAIAAVVGTVLVGLLAARHGSLRVIGYGAVLTTLGLVSSAISPSLAVLYVTYGLLVGFGTAMLGLVPTASLVSAHVHGRHGTALGTAFFAAAVSTFVLVPLVQVVNDTIGWRWSLGGLGILTAAALWPAIAAVARRSRPVPAATSAEKSPAEDSVGTDFLMSHAPLPGRAAQRRWLFQPVFLWLAGAHIGIGLSVGGVLVPFITHLSDRGIAPVVGATALSATILVTALGSLGGGRLSDTLGREATYSLSGLLRILGIGVLVFISADMAWWLVVFVVLFGLGWGSSGPLEAAIAADLFPGRSLPVRLGVLEGLTGASYGVAVFLVNVGRDELGTYTPGLVMAGTAVAVACSAYWVAAPRRARTVAG
jgi:MFS transporter, OFA family, oxalate/formate antiporter